MRQVRVQGCLPTLVVLAAVVALGVVAFTAGLAVMAGTALLLLLLAVTRAVRRLLGRAAPGAVPGADRPEVEVVPPGWASQQDGQVVDAEPREPPASGGAEREQDGPEGSGGRTLPPRG